VAKAKKYLIPRDKAIAVAHRVTMAIRHLADVYVAGSLRRGKHIVHDVDLVAVPFDELGVFQLIEGELKSIGPS